MAKNPHPREILTILHEGFPACISLDARLVRPLKVGIGRDISAAAPAISPIEIGIALKYYTNALPYLFTCQHRRRRAHRPERRAGRHCLGRRGEMGSSSPEGYYRKTQCSPSRACPLDHRSSRADISEGIFYLRETSTATEGQCVHRYSSPGGRHDRRA